MSQSDKKRRKAFLNDLCAKFGINSPTDPRRSDAAIAFIAYGEESCRRSLKLAGDNYSSWKDMVDIKHARRKISLIRRNRKAIRKTSVRKSASSATRVKRQKNVMPKPVHKVGGRMNPGRKRYLVGPDGIVI